jgi:hypothetical protein
MHYHVIRELHLCREPPRKDKQAGTVLTGIQLFVRWINTKALNIIATLLFISGAIPHDD